MNKIGSHGPVQWEIVAEYGNTINRLTVKINSFTQNKTQNGKGLIVDFGCWALAAAHYSFSIFQYSYAYRTLSS